MPPWSQQAKGPQDNSYKVPADQPKFPLRVDPETQDKVFKKPYFSDKVKESVKFRVSGDEA